MPDSCPKYSCCNTRHPASRWQRSGETLSSLSSSSSLLLSLMSWKSSDTIGKTMDSVDLLNWNWVKPSEVNLGGKESRSWSSNLSEQCMDFMPIQMALNLLIVPYNDILLSTTSMACSVIKSEKWCPCRKFSHWNNLMVSTPFTYLEICGN